MNAVLHSSLGCMQIWLYPKKASMSDLWVHGEVMAQEIGVDARHSEADHAKTSMCRAMTSTIWSCAS